jgi:hypothetical protein
MLVGIPGQDSQGFSGEERGAEEAAAAVGVAGGWIDEDGLAGGVANVFISRVVADRREESQTCFCRRLVLRKKIG